MKHGCELVVIGLAAVQGCSYFKSQMFRKIDYGNNPIPQNNQRTCRQQKQQKIVSCVLRISVCKIRQIQQLESKSFFACISQIPSFSNPMQLIASQELNIYLHCKAMIFVYTVFFSLYLRSFLPQNENTSEYTKYDTSFLTERNQRYAKINFTGFLLSEKHRIIFVCIGSIHPPMFTQNKYGISAELKIT